MINDLESNISTTGDMESTSDKFPLKRFNFNLPGLQSNLNILCMSSSKKYIFLLTDRAELLRIESNTLKPENQAYTIRSDDTSQGHFKENFTKIWTDRAGNHSIIRFSGKIFYYNSMTSNVKELNIFKGLEICAIGFDDINNKADKTGIFLASDYNNNIYECSISVDNGPKGEHIIKENKEKVSTISFRDWDTEDEDEIYEPKVLKNERIYGMKIFRTTKNKKDLKPGDDMYYIIAVTRSRIYEFKGPGESSFKQTFGRYNENPLLFNDSCKYFPYNFRLKNFRGTDLDILYRNDRKDQFGWKTDSGFCFGNFSFNGYLPDEIKKFTVIPFSKITNTGNKETEEPIAVTHTLNHIFILFKDSLTIISKLTSNIIHTQYLQSECRGLLFDEFYEKNGIILLYSKNGIYQVTLEDENKDIWQDYLDIGDYANAQRWCSENTKLIKKINRINADEFFQKKDYLNSAIQYNDSDEKFEVICLKYLMKNQLDALRYYLELYITKNVNIRKKYNLECNLIVTMIIEIFLNKSDKKTTVEEFRQLIREKRKYLSEGNIIKQLLICYGKTKEFVEFASIMGDLETAILYYINEGKIDEALENLTLFCSYIEGNEAYEDLKQIFLNNCHVFFKKNPKDSISLLKQVFKDVEMDSIVQAIISTTDKDSDYVEINNNAPNLEMSKKEENSQAILSYLKSLVEKPKSDDQQNNIHNLYIYYLSKNKGNQEAIIDFLKGPLKSEDEFNVFHKKKEALFQLDYAKKLFKDNPPAYTLVLALMGKYSDAVKTALKQKTEDCTTIAKFIASNAPGEKLRKQLWIDIFSGDSQNQFQEALKIMRESKILKIEDVLPHITDTIKIEEFKKQISNCINDYEDNIKKLKEDISDYNKTAENIKNDIIKIKKKSMEIQYSSCKCEICQGYIKDKNIFLFPCGHMFDAKCIKQCLLDYEATGLEYLHDSNKRIDELFIELGISTQKCFIDVSNKIKKDEEEKKQEEQSKASTIFNRFKINIDIPGLKKQEIVEEKTVKEPKKLREELNRILSQQCVLCGDYMVDSIQCSICKPEIIKPHKDGLKIRIKNGTGWDYIQ